MKFSIEEFEQLGSTQDFLKQRAAAGAAEGLVVQALAQSDGRGRHGRAWVSEPGNLYLSLLLRPDCGVSEIGRISLLTVVALAEVVEPYMDDPSLLRLKWPNDLLFGMRKGAGILLETELRNESIDWVCVGVGLNLVTAVAKIGDALRIFSSKSLDVNGFRDAFLARFAALYPLGFADIREKWLSYAFAPGTSMSVKIGTRLERGAFHDIDALGNLILKGAGGVLKTITAGDVYVTGD